MSEFQYKKIRILRENAKMSQKVLAKRLGISDRAVSKWETELSRPTADNILGLSRIFNVPVEYFFTAPRSAEKPKVKCGMESLSELYKIGRGPSSSHTIGPEKACRIITEKYPEADEFKIILYGSLAKTGKGHGTDAVIRKTLMPKKCTVEFDCTCTDIPHPNTMDIFIYINGSVHKKVRVLSVGGGSIVFDGIAEQKPPLIYKENSFSQIAEYCNKNSKRIWEYVAENEGPDCFERLKKVWSAMQASIKNGLADEGILPGGLGVHKKAKSLYNSRYIGESNETRENRIVCAYAFAVGEQNAAGETIVTAPTCGAAGVVPAVLYYHRQKHGFTDEEICRALATAGIIGNLIKTNASISGAECGCQAEVGSACAMAAAALGELYELSIDKIEYAAEIAIEHHLGLTCDPICGLVQIPCIERNAVAAMRAINAVNLASFLWDTRKISFDRVVAAMKETGLDLPSSYKETSEAGLAKIKL